MDSYLDMCHILAVRNNKKKTAKYSGKRYAKGALNLYRCIEESLYRNSPYKGMAVYDNRKYRYIGVKGVKETETERTIE